MNNDRADFFSEDTILDLINSIFPNAHKNFILGRGDDCAFFKTSHELCVSSDLFLENVHFRTNYFTPEEIGYKALAVNLSDLAACGASPLAFSLCLGIPKKYSLNWLKKFFLGMNELVQKYNLFLCGGDLTKSDLLHISITIFGESYNNSPFLKRSGAAPGDALFIVGDLGLAAVGLANLEKYNREFCETYYPNAVKAHLKPFPQIEAGKSLARYSDKLKNIANNNFIKLMDISDGLARDLPRLLGQNNANLELTPDIIHPEIIAHCENFGLNPVEEVYRGGEDYALLGACHADLIPVLKKEISDLKEIGRITECNPEMQIICNGRTMNFIGGFDHFKK